MCGTDETPKGGQRHWGVEGGGAGREVLERRWMIPFSLSSPRRIVPLVEITGAARRKGSMAYLLSHSPPSIDAPWPFWGSSRFGPKTEGVRDTR